MKISELKKTDAIGCANYEVFEKILKLSNNLLTISDYYKYKGADEGICYIPVENKIARPQIAIQLNYTIYPASLFL